VLLYLFADVVVVVEDYY